MNRFSHCYLYIITASYTMIYTEHSQFRCIPDMPPWGSVLYDECMPINRTLFSAINVRSTQNDKWTVQCIDPSLLDNMMQCRQKIIITSANQCRIYKQNYTFYVCVYIHIYIYIYLTAMHLNLEHEVVQTGS